jgi:hypothetical protein
MSEAEHTTDLAVSNPNSTRPTTGTNEAASRAETLTDQYSTENVSRELVADNGGDHTIVPSFIKTATKSGSNEKGNAGVTPADDAGNVTGKNQSMDDRTNDDDRYITGFRLFLVFVYITL